MFPALPRGLPCRAENSSADQRQACKKHELYVSFRDLGWQVRGAPHPAPPRLWAAPHMCRESRCSSIYVS